jgi:UDP-N-acetyl-2-amino-2-deoxyglucuronate dehydrogenase
MLNAAIIGCGNIFPMHANALTKLPDVKLVAVCDRDTDRATEAAKQYHCTPYQSFEEMVEAEDIDVLHICLPHYLHKRYAMLAAEHGINILTEKPMSLRAQDAEAMIQSARTNQVMLGVIFQNRYTKGIQELKKRLVAGALGKPLAAKLQVTWSRTPDYYNSSDWKGTWDREGGGVIIDQAIHTLDLVNWLIADQVIAVDSTMANRVHHQIKVEDFAEGVITYRNGCRVSFMANNYYSYDAPVQVEIHTTQALITIIGAKVTITYLDQREAESWDIPPEDYERFGLATKTYWGTGHIIEIGEYYEALRGNAQLLVTGEEALKTQKLIDAIYDAARVHKTVIYDEANDD